MSAFVVEDQVINRVLAFLSQHNGRIPNLLMQELGVNIHLAEETAKLGQSMIELNCNAVEQRYGGGEAKRFRELNYSLRREPTNIIQAYKSLRCWLYQCAEGDVPETSLLYATMSRISDMLAHEIVQNLPQYDRAAW